MAIRHVDLAAETSVQDAITKIQSVIDGISGVEETVTAIAQQATEINDDLTAVDTKIDNLNSAVDAAEDGINQNISGVGAKIDTANSGITTIKTAVAEMKTSIGKIRDALNVRRSPIYGFIEHMDILNPAQRIEYIGENKDFTPMSMNMTTHAMNYGSWNDFWFLLQNRPAMVKNDGTLDYWLNPDDYTKKEDGTASDVANLDYAGGAYAWIPKIYKKEYVIGNNRYVYFSQTKADDDFAPIGFIDPDGNELDGVWIPMFYGVKDSNGVTRTLATKNPTTASSITTDAQKAAIEKAGARHVFFGGAIVNTLVDLLTMFVKSTDSQSAYGKGASESYNVSATNYGMPDNSVVGGGQFYGSNDGKQLNKVLHSIVLGSQCIWVRDPYILVLKGTFFVSPNYKYDITGKTYVNTGIKIQDQGYRTKSTVVPGFGAVPTTAGGTSGTGNCDHVWVDRAENACCLRFAACSDGASGGLFCLDASHAPSVAWWGFGCAPLLLPPATA